MPRFVVRDDLATRKARWHTNFIVWRCSQVDGDLGALELPSKDMRSESIVPPSVPPPHLHVYNRFVLHEKYKISWGLLPPPSNDDTSKALI